MNLPESWVQARLTDVCELNPRLVAENRPTDDTVVSFVPMSAVDEHRGVINEAETRTFAEVAKGYTSFRERDVLFAKVTPCMENGKAFIARNLDNGLGFGSTEFHVLRPTKVVLPEYIFSFIRQEAFRERAASAFVGTGGLQRVPPDFLSRVKIPLPPLPEQQRIVEIFEEIKKISDLQKQVSEDWKNFKSALFFSFFGSPSENPNKYPVSQLGDLVDCVSGGTPARSVESYWKGTIPWVSPKDMKSQIISAAEEHISESAINNSATKIIPKGSVLVVTRSGILQSQIPIGITSCPVAINQDIKALVPKLDVNGAFIAGQLIALSPMILESVRQGATVHNLETSRLLKTKVIVPPLEIQEKYASAFQFGYDIFESVESKKRFFESLNKLIAAMGFAGELTSNWRERNQAQINSAAIERDALLRERGTNISLIGKAQVSLVAQTELPPSSARHWLLTELSEFQRQVLTAFTKYCQEGGQPLLVEDPEVFARFCNDTTVAERLQAFGQFHGNRIRRSLSQLASLGLIAKITLPKQDLESGELDYLKAFRPLRPEEFTRMSDVQAMRKELSSSVDQQDYYFEVQLDYETSAHAGASGMFQVIAVEDEDGKDFTHLVNLGTHYASLDDLKEDIASALKVDVRQVDLEAV